MSRLSATRASKKAAGVAGCVEDDRAGDLDLAHRGLPPVAGVLIAGPNGRGSRCSQRCTNTLIVPGPSRSQICCSAAGSSQAANPLDSAVTAIPARSAWRLTHSCPLSQILAGYGNQAHTLMNAGPKPSSHRAPVGRRRGACACRSFSGGPRPEPDVPAFRASRLSGDYPANAAAGCRAWMVSWQGGQATRVLRRILAILAAHAGCGRPWVTRSASLRTW